MADEYTADTMPTDVEALPNTNKIIRQTDCQYSFGKEAATFNLKFSGMVNEVTKLAADYRQGLRVTRDSMATDFAELRNILGNIKLANSGKVTSSTATTKTGCAQANISIQIPYEDRVDGESFTAQDEPEKRIIVTWAEKSTNNEYDLGIYCGDGQSASTMNAGEFEAWKNEKNKNIDNYKNFRYTGEDGEAVDLGAETKKVAEKWYKGVESVMRAYPEVIRTTQYLNFRGGKNEVDSDLLKILAKQENDDEGTAATRREPNLYYRDDTPAEVWTNQFPKEDWDWLKASFDVQTEATEYTHYWNITVTETWIGCNITDQGIWDNNLYGKSTPDPRWPFATAEAAGPDPTGSYDDGSPITPSDVNGPSGRVNNTTFDNQNNIKNLKLHGAYGAIDSNAFKGTPTRGTRSVSTGIPDLETISMPMVSFIGDDAFNGAANLKSISLSNKITYLGERVFQGCTSMTEAFVQPWLYTLPASTFEGCTSLDIPSTSQSLGIGGLVNSLGESSFKGCTSLRAVKCENALTAIGDNAFDGDVALKSFKMAEDENGALTIGDEAFKDCAALTTLELPVPSITIGTDAFSNAFTTALKLKVPVSFLSNVPSGTTYEYAYPGYVETIAANEFKNNTSVTGIEIPESVTTVGDNAFQNCTALTSIALHNAIIGNSMFRGCTSLTSVDIPDTVTSIGESAFHTTGLTSVVIPDSVTSMGESAFRNITSLTSVVIGTGITTIPAYTFNNDTSLASIDIQGQVTSIDAYAFNNCAAASMTLPGSVTSIGESAFGSMTNCTEFNFEDCTAVPTLENINAFYNTPTTKKIWIPYALASTWLTANNWSSSTYQINESLGYRYAYADGTTSIAANVWANDDHLFEVTIPDYVTSIGEYAFQNCTRLTSIDLPETLTTLGNGVFSGAAITSASIPASVTSFGTNMFNGCTGLTSVDLSSGLASIPIYTFYGCTALTEITLPTTVTTIGQYAFSGCTSLTSANIPSSVTTIDRNAFESTKLASVTVPDTVTSIGVRAFQNNTTLLTAEIGTGATTIPYGLFYGCSNLESVTFKANVTTTAGRIFQSVTNTGLEVTFEQNTMAEVQALNSYPWSMRTGQTIHCTDGDITIS